MHNIKYEQRIVVFLDVIGWQSATNHEEKCNEVWPVIEKFKNIYDIRTSEYKNAVRTSAEKYNGKVNPFFQEVEVAIFSDNIVISHPVTHTSLILYKAGDLCRELLAMGFLARGGIAIGNLYHKENVIFGPALNEAVTLEKDAIYPRILCSTQLIEASKDWHPTENDFPEEVIITDILGRKIINPFIPPLPLHGEEYKTFEEALCFGEAFPILKIRSVIEENTNKFSNSNNSEGRKKLEKWYFMRSLLENRLSHLETKYFKNTLANKIEK